jgi:hypothetical protein
MGFALSATGVLASVWLSLTGSELKDFILWILSPIWFIAFIYLTEKRFVIIRIATYIRDKIEREEAGYGWETSSRELAKYDKYERPLYLDPYHIEVMVSSLALVLVPILGGWWNAWDYGNPYFISSVILVGLFLVCSIRTLKKYGFRPQNKGWPEVERRPSSSF